MTKVTWDLEKNGVSEKDVCKANKNYWWLCEKGHSWQAKYKNVRVNKHGCPYCSNQKVLIGYNDLQTTEPEIAKEWDFDKNGCTPQEVTRGSTKKVWWLCSKGHSYQASVNNRTKAAHSGCPYCSGKKVLPGFNDLATTHPDLIGEWDEEKNMPLTPQQVSKGAQKKVWWKCKKGHSWQSSIINRVKGRDCPYCSNKIVLFGFNDLQTMYPNIAKEWNTEKNNGATPNSIYGKSAKKVWWRCPNGHSWEATVASRTIAKSGCPYCAGNLAIAGENDIGTLRPDLMAEWDKERNPSPTEFKIYSDKKVWWICSAGHHYFASISNRNIGRGCPFCSGNKLVQGKNDLASQYPEIAAEWDFEANEGITPSDVFSVSGKKYSWRCQKGHKWVASVDSRISGTGCPVCASKIVLPGYNDLQTTNPEYLKTWDYQKNTISPAEITSGSSKLVWWICDKGHSWKASPNTRLCGAPNSCPQCGRNTSLPEEYLSAMFKLAFPDAQCNVRPPFLKRKEYDAYSPSANDALEYNGAFFHLNKQNEDIIKLKMSKANHVTLIRVLEPGLKPSSDYDILMVSKKYKDALPEAAKQLKKLLEELLKRPIDDSTFLYDYEEFIKRHSA